MSLMELPEALAIDPYADAADLPCERESDLTPEMTLEQVLLLPDDLKRDLIDGRLVEYPMTMRNRWHARTEFRLCHLLGLWLDTMPEPRGEVVSGEAGFRLRRNPDTSYGIDLAYVSAEVFAATPDTSPYIEGPPILAIEILSPSTVNGHLVKKIRSYLTLGVPLVWIVDPDFRTVVVHRPGVAPEMFNITHELTGGAELPGFRVRVAAIFA